MLYLTQYKLLHVSCLRSNLYLLISLTSNIPMLNKRSILIIIIINVYRLFFPCKHGSDVSPKIFLFHNCLSWASPTLKPKSFMSLVTHCNHVFLPLPTFPSTSTFVHFLTQSSSAFLSTCPNHLNLPHLTISVTASILRLFLSSSDVIIFFRVTPHIHLTIIFSVLSYLCLSSTFMGHVSLPYTMTL